MSWTEPVEIGEIVEIGTQATADKPPKQMRVESRLGKIKDMAQQS